jgi:hypothetical protein
MLHLSDVALQRVSCRHGRETERAVVTYNRDDVLELDRRYRRRDRSHNGIVILNPRRLPQGPGSIGRLVKSLEGLISGGPPYQSFIHWLQ